MGEQHPCPLQSPRLTHCQSSVGGLDLELLLSSSLLTGARLDSVEQRQGGHRGCIPQPSSAAPVSPSTGHAKPWKAELSPSYPHAHQCQGDPQRRGGVGLPLRAPSEGKSTFQEAETSSGTEALASH